MLVGFPWISNLGFLIFLGGLQNLPKDVLDAGRLDGLSAVRRVFAIDIPLLMPQFRIVVILSGIFAVQNFIPILLLTNGGPGTATLVPGLDMYQSAFARTTSTATAWPSAPCSSSRCSSSPSSRCGRCVRGRTDPHSHQEVRFHDAKNSRASRP